ncbi:MAG TPA: 5-dehydro-2-deoxygluconokinase [Pyrinomonadaceae bacterium]|nr:5-dehydro-2-deoxygluconokinase [Pyrinomonadaceae bacterium]
MESRKFDVLAVGRSSIDLYANEVGVPFTEIKSFAAYVGGCPTNITVAARRLGLRTAILNPLGDDLVADFVLNFLEKEGVDTTFSRRKVGRRTSAFLLGIEPPDRFSLVPYRDNCPDLELTIEDIQLAPVAASRALLLTGTGLSRQPSRDATHFAARRARDAGTKIVLDLDFRAELWPDLRAYEVEMRSFLPSADVVLGTADEVEKAGLENWAEKTSAATRAPEALVVKRGAESTLVYPAGGRVIEAATFPVEVLNVLGAGDAFAGGFLYGYLKNWGWHKSARMGNACGAIVVTRHGCANFMPYEDEALAFIKQRGGF